MQCLSLQKTCGTAGYGSGALWSSSFSSASLDAFFGVVVVAKVHLPMLMAETPSLIPTAGVFGAALLTLTAITTILLLGIGLLETVVASGVWIVLITIIMVTTRVLAVVEVVSDMPEIVADAVIAEIAERKVPLS